MTTKHNWVGNAPYCSCGQDTVTCQGCGKLVCGDVSVRHDNSNIGPCCFAKFGLGHQGKDDDYDNTLARNAPRVLGGFTESVRCPNHRDGGATRCPRGGAALQRWQRQRWGDDG